MSSLHLISLALALLCAPITFALTIEAPSTIAAGQTVQVNINNDIWNSTSSSDARSDTYRLSLIASQNHTAILSLYPSCWLINSTALPDSNFTASVTIPVSVGPAGSYYQLTTEAWNSNSSTTWSSGTDWFDLTGATGAWSISDLEGYLPYNEGNVPCSSLMCINACQDQLGDDEDVDEYEIASLIVCLENCDDVPIADYLFEEVDAAALSSASASFAATHTASASAASITGTSATLTSLSSGTTQSSGGQSSSTATSGATGIGAASMLLMVVASCSTLRTFL